MKITVGARILFASFLIVLTGMLYFFGMLRGQDRLSYLLTSSLTSDLAGMQGALTLKQGFVMHDDLLFRYISVGNSTYLEESLQWRARIQEVLGNRNAMPRSQIVDELLT